MTYYVQKIDGLKSWMEPLEAASVDEALAMCQPGDMLYISGIHKKSKSSQLFYQGKK